MAKYYSIFSDIINELTNNPKFTVITYHIKSGHSAEDIARLEKDKNISINQSIKEFYAQISSIQIIWSYLKSPGENKVYGEINIVDLINLLDQPQSNSLWIGRLDEKMKKKFASWLETFYLFDFFNSDESEMSGFIKSGSDITPQLAYYKEHLGFMELKLTLTEYIDLLKRTRGTVGWQSAYLDGDIENFLKNINGMFKN